MKRKGDEAPDEFVLADVERRLSRESSLTSLLAWLPSPTPPTSAASPDFWYVDKQSIVPVQPSAAVPG